MATKPTSLPRWGEVVGSQNVIGPNEIIPVPGKLDIGWVPGEEPPAQYWNWWQRLVYDWIQYLADLENQNITFTGQLTVPAPGTGGAVANRTYVDTTDKANAHTWSGQQQFSGFALQHVGNGSASDDAASWGQVQTLVNTTLLGRTNTWAALQTFSGGISVSGKITATGTATNDNGIVGNATSGGIGAGVVGVGGNAGVSGSPGNTGGNGVAGTGGAAGGRGGFFTGTGGYAPLSLASGTLPPNRSGGDLWTDGTSLFFVRNDATSHQITFST